MLPLQVCCDVLTVICISSATATEPGHYYECVTISRYHYYRGHVVCNGPSQCPPPGAPCPVTDSVSVSHVNMSIIAAFTTQINVC